jgi:tetratricopeptide (TPR) repeat protein
MNPLKVRSFLLLLVLLSLTAKCALAQFGQTFHVKLSGTVYSTATNRPIEQAQIRLLDSGGSLVDQSSTDAAGEFGFRGLALGNYVLRVEAVGYEREELTVDLGLASDKGIIIRLNPTNQDQSSAASSGQTVSAHEMSMPKQARELVSSGRVKLYTQKNPQASLQDFARALAKAPEYYEAQYEIGMAQVRLGHIEDAETSFRKSIEVSKDTYGDGEVALGTLLVENGSATEGENALRRGVGLNPNSWMGYFELGKLELNQNRLDDARQSAEQARSLAPSVPITYRLLTKIHLQQQDYNAVLQDLDAYLKLDPNSPAGVRAKQIREEVAKKLADSK